MSKKGIIVLDKIPKCCDKCDFEVFYGKCRVKNDALVDDRYNKPDACPIKELPKEDNGTYFPDEYLDGYANGWNACIDEILSKKMEVDTCR